MKDLTAFKNERQFHALTFKAAAADADSRTVELAFSSEEPYERWFGTEILDHGKKSIRLGRLKDGAPLLLGHDPDKQIGVVESVTLGEDRVARAKVRFGKGALASEIYQDVVDGIRQKVSVGYMIHDMVLDSKKGDAEVYRVTDWEPFEVSIVSIPADNTVGVGRSDEKPTPPLAKEIAMTETVTPTAPAVSPAPAVDVRAIEVRAAADARTAELKRMNDLEAMGKKFAHLGGEELSRQFIREGKSVEDFGAVMLEKASEKKPTPTPFIGMNERELQRFSWLRAMNAIINPNDRQAQADAAYELELSNEARRKMGKEARGHLTVPYDVLAAKRDLTVGTATAGGNTVATDLLAGSFIDLLRHRLALTQMGITMLDGLVGNIAIPKQTGAATAYWVAENSSPTESQQTVGQVTMSPKTVGAYTDFSRRLMLQSSISVENFVRTDLVKQLGLAIDLAGIAGTGASNQPTGILSTAGIGSVAGGTNGAAVNWSNIVDLESAVAIANADVGTTGYLTNAKQRGVMKKTSKVSGQNGFIWDNGNTPVNGYNCGISNQVPSNLVKGSSGAVCSAIIFGNWADLVLGMWGGLDLMVDPYTGSTAGTVRVVALQDVDFAVRNAVSFAAMVDAL